ncbi:hypothetical protein FGADI_5435 [Fusarium gaditjirri]|uniref:Alcohol dehydrogenase-like N-terminal domain-containing protein n=1 Tax=Fusarium gaditjirri TaxID=282569 RepID=A0A8H4TAT4_9HYPO|nr:hypothetical protein FGADI_5435 [Fusarium gaditjirri]
MPTVNAWQFKTADGGCEENLFLMKPNVADNQVLAVVFATALNPVNYKLPEMGLVAKLIFPSPYTPVRDFCGNVVQRGTKATSFQAGEIVFGTYVGTSGQGTFTQCVSLSEETIVSMPEGLRVGYAASISMVGLTAYQTVKQYVKRVTESSSWQIWRH